MRRTSNRTTFRASAPRRKLTWVRGNATFTASTAGSVDLLVSFRSLMGITANLPGSTAVRIHADVQANYDPGATATQPVDGITDGIQVHEIGVPPPNPLVNLNDDWMYWRWHPLSGSGENLNPVFTANNGGTVYSWSIDNKSMRKLDEAQQTLWYVWQTNTLASGIQAALFLQWSILLKMA